MIFLFNHQIIIEAGYRWPQIPGYSSEWNLPSPSENQGGSMTALSSGIWHLGNYAIVSGLRFSEASIFYFLHPKIFIPEALSPTIRSPATLWRYPNNI